MSIMHQFTRLRMTDLKRNVIKTDIGKLVNNYKEEAYIVEKDARSVLMERGPHNLIRNAGIFGEF